MGMDVGVKEILNYELMKVKKCGYFSRKNVCVCGGGRPLSLSVCQLSVRERREAEGQTESFVHGL